MNVFLRLVLAVAMLPIALLSTAQDTPTITFKAGKGLRIFAADSSASLKVGLRIQPLLVAESADGVVNATGVTRTNFSIRRARLKFSGFVVSPKWKYKLELSLGNRNNGGVNQLTGNGSRLILDAYVDYLFAKRTTLRIGQAKLPGNRERVVSSGKLQFVDRSAVNSRFNIDRDMGLQLIGNYALGDIPLNLIFAWSIGEGRNNISNNIGGFEYTGRAEILPLGEFKSKGDYVLADLSRETTPKLSIGVTYDYNDRAVRQRGNQGSFMLLSDGSYYQQSLHVLIADALWKYKGWSALVEVAKRSASLPLKDDNDEGLEGTHYTGSGLNVQFGYLFDSNIEIAARFTTVNPDKTADVKLGNQQFYTAGLSKYIVGHSVKVQSDVTYGDFEYGIDPYWMFRMQLEIGF